jgi:hypothetical protein
VGNRGTATSKTSGTTLTATVSANVAAGDILIVIIAKDNTGTTDGDFAEVSGVSDSKGNTYTKAKEFTNGQGGAGSGATVSVWFSKITTALGTTDTVTASFASAITAKAMTLAEFSVAAGATLQVAASGATAGDAVSTLSTSITGLASAQYLFIAGDAYEGTCATKTESAGFTSIPSAGTTGGGAATNMCVYGAYQIATATGATYSPTFSAAADIAQVLVAFQERLPQAFTANPKETLVLSDSTTRIYKAQRPMGESVPIATSLIIRYVGARSMMESSLLNDVVARSYRALRSIMESLALADALRAIRGLLRTASENVMLSSSLTGLFRGLRSALDNITLSSAIGRVYAGVRSLSDALMLNDILSRLYGIVRSLAENIGLSDFIGGTVQRIAGIIRSIAETISLSDYLGGWDTPALRGGAVITPEGPTYVNVSPGLFGFILIIGAVLAYRKLQRRQRLAAAWKKRNKPKKIKWKRRRYF